MEGEQVKQGIIHTCIFVDFIIRTFILYFIMSSVFYWTNLHSVELPQTTHPGGPNSTAWFDLVPESSWPNVCGVAFSGMIQTTHPPPLILICKY